MTGVALTRVLAEFVAGHRGETMPAAVGQEATRAIADCIGAAMAGRSEPVAGIVSAQAAGETGPCVLWGHGATTTARNAALINGCVAHAHAIDDTHESMRGHPSVPVVPAVFAVADEIGAGGAQRLSAYAVGVEVAAKLGRAVNDRHAQIGWHTTCTLGSVGAAAAAAHLLGLDAHRTAHALGMAASMAGGLRVNFGTMTKPLHAGLAAHNGVLAARLAAGGMTASPVALEGGEGFLDLFCGAVHSRPERAVESLGQPYELLQPGIVYKLYPTCSLMHALIDLVLDAVAGGHIERHDVAQVRCRISRRLEAARGKRWPAGGMEAKFHVEYCVGVALAYGRQALGDFSDASVHDPLLRPWADRILVEVGDDFPADNGDFAEVIVTHRTRPEFRARQAKPRGHPSLPLSAAEHAGKFVRCAQPLLGEARARNLHETLMQMPALTADDLRRALALDSQP
ncbi:MmgE/PrpD family protein [Variovorax terrae]|uniref:MmgE/PrpD family protein n=1 Tax=Variovorax terrae TaxID=2923278 RepID=A0A9X2ARQ8_9BURK|nr:MmgE/PrpD family protein [Variovorax terrae]MCJ0764451.1 MmgE/PrpD family protein [Variovorax terrae]